MTMTDKKCDVCRTGQAIGVASTVMPYSCAYCVECCKRFAQPLIVFECFWEDVGTDFGRLIDGGDKLETYDSGRYQTYREWATNRAGGTVYNGRSAQE
jgi:hypothetical protein